MGCTQDYESQKATLQQQLARLEAEVANQPPAEGDTKGREVMEEKARELEKMQKEMAELKKGVRFVLARFPICGEGGLEASPEADWYQQSALNSSHTPSPQNGGGSDGCVSVVCML